MSAQKITRRSFVKTSVAGITALKMGGLGSSYAASGPRPNILVLVADDAGARHFGCYGNKAIRTPHIDRLAAHGLAADNAILTTPQCSPSRISILTGHYPHATGAEDLHMHMPPDLDMVPGLLQQGGYFTGHMQKTHYGPNGDAQFQWYDEGLNQLPAFLDDAGDRPFFMWVGFSDPHRPYQRDTIATPHNPETVDIPPYMADTPETRADIAAYYDEISRMDGVIGDMMRVLEQRRIMKDTLVIFLSDNGAPFPREKGALYDSGIRTPLVFHWPGVVPAGKRHAGLMSVIDLAPTLVSLAGVTPPPMQGNDISAGLANPSIWQREAAYSERNWHDCDEHIRSVRTQRFKLIHNAYIELPFGSPADVSESPSWRALYQLKQAGKLNSAQARLFEVPRPEIEFYDIVDDPWELNNLAGEPAYREAIRAHFDLYESWREETNDFPPHRRRRHGYADRVTGTLFSLTVPPLYNL